MNRPTSRARAHGGRSGLRALICTVAVLTLASATTAAGASTAHNKKLSQTNVVVTGSLSGNPILLGIGLTGGFLKKQGLNATFLRIDTGSAPIFAALLGGAAQFAFGGASASVLAAEQGAQVKALMSFDIGSPTELVINTAKAAGHNIPQSSSTAAQAKAQLLALKGSGLTIGVSSTTSDAYNILVALMATYGLTQNDVHVTPLGSVQNLVTGLASNKIDGFVNTPPNTVQANTITIPLYKIAPIPKYPWEYLIAPTSFVKAHPDTSQAAVTAFVQAWQYVKGHPKGAQRLITNWAFVAGENITSPEQQLYLWEAVAKDLPTPLMSRVDFATMLHVLTLAQGQPINVPFNSYIYPKFVQTAVKQLGLHPPSA